MTDKPNLSVMALKALFTAAIREDASERDYDDAIKVAQEARDAFTSALFCATGIDPTLWELLWKEEIVP